MNKKSTLLIPLFSLLLLSAVSFVQPNNLVVHAQETEQTETASGSATFENIKKIIKENIENSKVKGAIDNLLNRRVALIGEVSRVTGETITITNRLGTRIIPISEAIAITKAGKSVEISDIAVENWVTVLGRTVDDTFSPVFVDISTESLRPKPQYVGIGTITEITNTTLTILPRSGESEKTIKLVRNTTYEDQAGEEINLSQLTEDITVLVTGFELESGVEALTVRSLATISEDQ